jgi:hypothetical protein
MGDNYPRVLRFPKTPREARLLTGNSGRELQPELKVAEEQKKNHAEELERGEMRKAQRKLEVERKVLGLFSAVSVRGVPGTMGA